MFENQLNLTFDSEVAPISNRIVRANQFLVDYNAECNSVASTIRISGGGDCVHVLLDSKLKYANDM